MFCHPTISHSTDFLNYDYLLYFGVLFINNDHPVWMALTWFPWLDIHELTWQMPVIRVTVKAESWNAHKQKDRRKRGECVCIAAAPPSKPRLQSPVWKGSSTRIQKQRLQEMEHRWLQLRQKTASYALLMHCAILQWPTLQKMNTPSSPTTFCNWVGMILSEDSVLDLA